MASPPILSSPHLGLEPHFQQIHKTDAENDPLARVFIRRRVVFAMDGYRYAVRAVKERWNIDFTFFEAGRSPIKEVFQSTSLNTHAATTWLAELGRDQSFGNGLVQELTETIDQARVLTKKAQIAQLSPSSVSELLRNHLTWWVAFFEVAFLWFALDPIQERTSQEIRAAWKNSTMDVADFLSQVYRPSALPLSSREQRDLLKITDFPTTEQPRALLRHCGLYGSLSMHVIDDEPFNLEYYESRFQRLMDERVRETERIALQTADNEICNSQTLINQSDLSADLKQRLHFIRSFIYLRTESIDHMMLVNGAYKRIFLYLSDFFQLSLEEALHMTYDEILDSIRKGSLLLPKEVFMNRAQEGYAYLIAPYGEWLVTGKDIDALQELFAPPLEPDVREVKGQSAFPGRAQGRARVILDRKEASQVEQDEILVTPMTSPEFVPAMRLAKAIVTNEGGILCHAAIMSRELRKPCVIGTRSATHAFKTGDIIEVDADRGVVKKLRDR